MIFLSQTVQLEFHFEIRKILNDVNCRNFTCYQKPLTLRSSQIVNGMQDSLTKRYTLFETLNNDQCKSVNSDYQFKKAVK